MPTDQEELHSFIERVRTILSEIVGAQNHLLRKEMRPLFTAAWAEVEPLIPNVQTQVKLLSDDRLTQLGLSGAQLRLKLQGFRLADTALTSGGWRSRLVKKVLDWINILLGSILAGVPGAEPLKELKESIEAEIDD